ncbi:MarR family winged helix-turn-helix transcriptional regulator [Polynucleobacter sinensis]|uniref:MarR family winged helix-turn-helix transcriptional regulator n=1 Tax=Polynucleobacter sinensis TaxID=1743157 RepID=UPI000782CC85|nr:MarR family transcriptional regulator [Polynucleobacter sinensis]
MKKTFRSPISVSKKELLDKPGNTDKRFRQLIYDLSVAGSLLEVARQNLAKKLGVSPPQYNILMVIAQYQGANGLRFTEVADHLHVTVSHVTSEVKKLEKLKWLSVVTSHEDKRARLVKINQSAESKILSLGNDQRGINDHLFRNLSKSDFDKLSAIMAQTVEDFMKTIELLKSRHL